MNDHLLLLILCVAGSAVLAASLKKNGPMIPLLSALCGIAALFAADLVCGFFDMNLPVNAFTLGVSAVFGMPGVILLNILNVMLK